MIRVLSAQRDRLEAILLTGDTSTAVREMAAGGRLHVASKPIRTEQLLALIQELSYAYRC